MIKINHRWISGEYEHQCSACGRILGLSERERVYFVNMDKVTIKLCHKCKSTLGRKLNNYNE